MPRSGATNRSNQAATFSLDPDPAHTVANAASLSAGTAPPAAARWSARMEAATSARERRGGEGGRRGWPSFPATVEGGAAGRDDASPTVLEVGDLMPSSGARGERPWPSSGRARARTRLTRLLRRRGL